MANAIYPIYKQAVLTDQANTDIITGTIRVVLIDAADYTFSTAHNVIED